jgi:hypothetical protein
VARPITGLHAALALRIKSPEITIPVPNSDNSDWFPRGRLGQDAMRRAEEHMRADLDRWNERESLRQRERLENLRQRERLESIVRRRTVTMPERDITLTPLTEEIWRTAFPPRDAESTNGEFFFTEEDDEV